VNAKEKIIFVRIWFLEGKLKIPNCKLFLRIIGSKFGSKFTLTVEI